uniref:Probable RNA-binding protein 18 n=1 Tax=Oryctolagus cuniculus TaxID=9986 RepID=A0A5F9DLD0_RABIT
MAEQFIVACHMLPNKLKMGIDLMEAETKTLPLENASILSEGSLQEGHRLWIGNLDPKITEYHLLKLLQRFGKVKQFDFLFHKSGALEGQPRGYCFVNFETKQEAEQAIQCLNGKLALSKKLVVRWAHAQVKRYDHNKNDKILPISLEPSSSTEPTQSNLRTLKECARSRIIHSGRLTPNLESVTSVPCCVGRAKRLLPCTTVQAFSMDPVPELSTPTSMI